MRVGRVGDEEQNGSVKTVAARRSSERLKKLDRTATLGCSEFRDAQKISPISRSFSVGAAGTGETFFADSPAVDEHVEATGLLQTLADALPQSTHNSPLEELAIVDVNLAFHNHACGAGLQRWSHEWSSALASLLITAVP
jgi:hypothetical protein